MTSDSDAMVLNYLEQFAGQFNAMVKQILTRNLGDGQTGTAGLFDPDNMMELLPGSVRVDTAKLLREQMSLMEQQMVLWQSATRAMLGEKVEPVVSEARGDGRFRHADWTDHPVYSYLKQAYLLNSRMLASVVDSLQFEDSKAAEQAKFYTRQFISAVSPSNYVLTNPDVCREILETKGQNLVRGMENFMRDLERSPAEAFRITQTDPAAFTLGENLATNPGQVIHQNELMQLLQYDPATETVYRKPLLIVPAFINKYYILDLDARKSMVRWLVAQGYTVFMISWVNPDACLAHKGFVDYMKEGLIAALDAIEDITGENRVNAVGYCVGGTLLAATQAYLKATGDERLHSLSFFASLLDFSEPGEVGNYISGEIVPLVEQNARTKGVFDGRIVGLCFSMLRENSLFWSYFVNNYLKGRDPAAFDMLHWNGDATNLPAEMFCFYLRNTYLENRLAEPGAVALDGVPIDLGDIDTPAYFVATLADHIVLWPAAYRSAQLLSGSRRFVLSGSGHMAGVINPPDAGKYCHWINDELPEAAEAWFESATRAAGSWWPDWDAWLALRSGDRVPCRKPGSNELYPALEAAPGSYVKVRI